MKSLLDYLAESEHRAANPVAGDDFSFELDDGTAVDTYILEATEDEILVDANEATWAVMEQWMGFDDILSEGCACEAELDEAELDEAEYQGRKVTLNKPMRGDQKNSKCMFEIPKLAMLKKSILDTVAKQPNALVKRP